MLELDAGGDPVQVDRRAESAGRAAAFSPAAPDLERRDLEAKRDALIVQLRELEDTAAKRSREQLASERYELELEAARAWRALDEHALAVPAAVRAEMPRSVQVAGEAAPAGATAPSAWKGFLWGSAR